MGNSIMGKKVLMMVVGWRAEGRWSRPMAALGPMSISSFSHSEQAINPLWEGGPCLHHGCRTDLIWPVRGAAGCRGGWPGDGQAPAQPCSSGIVGAVFLQGSGKGVCVCRSVDVQEAQSEAFLFIVTLCRMRKSPADTHVRHTPLHPHCEIKWGE